MNKSDFEKLTETRLLDAYVLFGEELFSKNTINGMFIDDSYIYRI